MIKLTKKIVNENFHIIGFEVVGKAREFGELGNTQTVRRITGQDLINMNFRNTQIRVENKAITELGDFRLRDLPVIMLKKNKFIGVDNTITLISRVLIDGELKGFDTIVAGDKKRLVSSDVINLAKFFVPENFVVRYTGDKQYIVGKPGMKLETLPEVRLTSGDTKNNKKAAVRTAEKGTKGAELVRISPFDMITLCDVVKGLGGKFIYLPGAVYNRTTALTKETSKEFKKTGVEVAKPEIAVSEKKLNVNLQFDQIGKLVVNVAGVDKAYYPFVNKNKTIFKGGELNSPYLGIAIKQDCVNEIQKQFGASMSLSVITDTMTNLYVKMFLHVANPDDYVLLALDTRNLSPMCKASAEKYLMSEDAIKDTVVKMLNVKAALSYTKGLRKDLELMTTSETGTLRPLYGQYRSCSEVELKALDDAGIDVYTGAFIKTNDVDPSKVAKEEAERAEESNPDVEVAWGINGMKSAPTYATIKKDKEKALAKYPMTVQLIAEADKIYGTTGDPNTVYKKLKKYEDSLNDNRLKLMKKLQMHNIAAYTIGGYQDIKCKDKAGWGTLKTVKGGTVWGYKDGELTCTLSNSTLV